MIDRSERLVWICQCGCVTGWLHEDGTWECAECGTFANDQADMSWVTRNDTPPIAVERPDAFKIVDMNSSMAAYDRGLRALQSRKDEVVGFVILYGNGNNSTWFDVSTEEHLAWVKKQLEEVKEYADAKFQNQSAIRQARTKDRDGV